MGSIWSLTNAGTTKTSDAWGVVGMARHRESTRSATVTFSVPGNMDSAPIFAQWSAVTITRDGVGWFAGLVTKIPRKASTKAESLQYEISDPWWYLENITFQQMWQAITGTVGGGAGVTTSSTLVSRILATRSLDGVKLDYGAVIKEVLIYALYARQRVAFPGTVDLITHLPAIPPLTGTPNPPPFLLGAITPTLTGPYFEVRDRTCAEIIQHILRYLPDYVHWFDFTTTPPTLNIDHRSNLPVRTIKTLTSNLSADGYGVEGFNPTSRDDLVVPVVVAKYEQTNTVDGKSKFLVNVDSYPAAPGGTSEDVWRSQERALVQTIDLVGTTISLAKQTVSVRSRPISTSTPEQQMGWLLKHNKDMAQYDFSVAQVTAGKIVISSVATVVDPNAKALGAPYDMPADGTGYNYELIDGNCTPWMYDDASLLSADAHLLFTMTYTGTDAATLAYFAAQPTPGTLIVSAKCKITNAGGAIGWTDATVTTEYETIASESIGETPPIGYAAALYNTLRVPHQQGDLLIVEEECGDRLPVGCVFNTSDNLAAFQAMQALVLSVTENIDQGTTRVEFGPTLHLGLAEMVELRRANRGRVPSFALDQHDTGSTSAGATIQGANHGPASSSHMPPAVSPVLEFPFQVIWRKNPANPLLFQAMVNLDSSLLKSQNLFDNVAITGLNTWFDCTANDTFWLMGAVSSLALSGSPTIHSFGQGHTDYNPAASDWTTGGTVENDSASPPNQTFFRKVIAVSVADGAGRPSITNKVSTNLKLVNETIAGLPAIYPEAL